MEGDPIYRRAADDAVLVLRLTRQWLHYGTLAYVLICVLFGAVLGALGR